MMPLIDQVQQAIQAMQTPRKPRIQSAAADLAFRQIDLRERLHQRGILTVGIPSTVEPLPRTASPPQMYAAQQTLPFPQAPSVHQVQVATACGYSRPFVERLIHQLANRGGTQLKYKGHRGAFLQTMTAILAHNSATLKRIEHQQLTQRAQRFRRLFRLKPPNSLQNKAPLN